VGVGTRRRRWLRALWREKTFPIDRADVFWVLLVLIVAGELVRGECDEWGSDGVMVDSGNGDGRSVRRVS